MDTVLYLISLSQKLVPVSLVVHKNKRGL